jgi:hypothetical protein
MELDDPALWRSYHAAVALWAPRRVSEGHPPRTVLLRYRYDWGELEEIDDLPCGRYPLAQQEWTISIPLPALVRGYTRSDCRTERNHGFCTDHGPFSLLLWPSDDRILVVGRQYMSRCHLSHPRYDSRVQPVSYDLVVADGDAISLSEQR